MNTPKAAIYIRVSTEEQAVAGFSLPAQRSILTDYATQHGYEVFAVYADEGVSGRSTKNRFQLQQLLDDSKRGLFSTVLVWKISRFARSIRDLAMICETLMSHGVTFISYSESFDCSTAAGKLMLNVLGAISQWESDVISENVRMAMHERAMRGGRTCGEVLGYDVIPDAGMSVNKKEADVIRFVFDQFRRYKSYSEVSRALAKAGHVGKRGRPISPEGVYKILTCAVYAGYYKWGDARVKGDFDPILTVKQFNAAQAVISRMGGKRKGRPII